mmetsp:Transcript_9778/g.17278  ORF Transcript_9778/g.17278 Transcript_9778/m.17278 type:complete len:1066 (-) Transcript_9778:166-3363(-)
MRGFMDGAGVGGPPSGRRLGSPLPPPAPQAAPPISGLPPPRPPGLQREIQQIHDRSRAVRFEPLNKVRSRSTDDVPARSRFSLQSATDDEGGDAASKPHHNIHVAVRCRGMLPQEIRDGGRAIVQVLNGKLVILEDPHTTAADDYLRINKSKERRYAFDEVFNHHAAQSQVYEGTTKALICGVLEGFNATCFAYGATSAGKTYTMLGNPTQPGIMMLTLHDLFAEVAQHEDRIFEVKCSFLEVYNENIRDLLRPDGDYLDIREDPVKGMCVAGISEVGGLESAKEIMSLLHQANRHRTTESTGANVTSSRSHAVLQVVVEQRDKTAGIVAQVNVGKLSMIDLAGSERASHTHNKGMRMIEGANINRSLLALGNCITALSSGVAFVPYRDSKMTRLLKDSLGGNCRTVMIANVSPCHLNYEDTHNTLKYASRARNIKTKAMRNIVSVNYHLSKYTEIIKELKGEIVELKTKLAQPDEASSGLRDLPRDAAGLLDRAAADLQLPGNASNTEAGLAGEHERPVTANELESAHVQSTKWKQELMQNFEERVRVKRRLIDLAQAHQNQMVQKSRAQVGISQWESSQVNRSDDSTSEYHMPPSIRDLQEQMQSIKTEMKHTEAQSRELEEKLVENLKVSERLQAELPTRVPNKDMRAFLGLVYRIYVLEVENIDLQEMNDVTQPLLQQKELEAEALRLQIRMRDRLIEEQDKLLSLDQRPLPKAEGWQEIPSKPSRRPLSPLEDDDRHNSSAASGTGATDGRDGFSPTPPRSAGLPLPPGYSRRAKSAGPTERPVRNNILLPPLSPTGHGRFALRGVADRGPHLPDGSDGGVGDRFVKQNSDGGGSGGSAVGLLSGNAAVLQADASELPSLDIAGRGLGLPGLPRSADGDLPSHRPARDSGRDALREVPRDARPPHPGPPSSAPTAVVGTGVPWQRTPSDGAQYAGLQRAEGNHASERRGRAPGQADGRRQNGVALGGHRRGRKSRRGDAAARARREDEKQQLHIEAAGLHGARDDHSGSSSERTPHRIPTKDVVAQPAGAAGRRGIIEKLNRRMKPPAVSPYMAAPKNLS